MKIFSEKFRLLSLLLEFLKTGNELSKNKGTYTELQNYCKGVYQALKVFGYEDLLFAQSLKEFVELEKVESDHPIIVLFTEQDGMSLVNKWSNEIELKYNKVITE